MVYLRAPLDVILERIQQRGRTFERNIDPGYLKDLCEAYDRFFGQHTECPVLIVDTEELNFPQEQAHFETVFNAIQSTAHNLKVHDTFCPVSRVNPHFKRPPCQVRISVRPSN